MSGSSERRENQTGSFADRASERHLARSAGQIASLIETGASGPATDSLSGCPGSSLVSEPRSGVDVVDGEVRWQVHCLLEIANFSALRRRFGRSSGEWLAADIADHIANHTVGTNVAPIGRSQVELLFESDAPEAAVSALEHVRMAFAEPIELGGGRHRVRLVVGMAAVPLGACDEVCLAEAAEAALEQAREHDELVLLDLSRDELVYDRSMLMRDMPAAIASGQMFLQYQPKVHVRRQEIASAEALIRWQHPHRGLILPGDFISIAEESGEIRPLTMWTLRQVIADQRRLDAAGHCLTLFINISGLLLADSSFVEEAMSLISESGARIGFEITETSVIRDPELAIRHLKSLAEVGVALSIDDYGAGLSSLAYLKQLPASELKIDKMFVMQLTSSNRDPLIVRSTIDLAHALEMEVTAEGVETPSALALLTVMGCDMVQGYLISRPLVFDAFRNFLDQDGHLTSTSDAQSSFLRPEGFWKRA